MFDLYYFTLHLEAGRETPDLPGLLATPATRRAARNRSGDLFIAMLSQVNGSALPEANVQELLQQAAALYFNTNGSVTAGLRSTAEELNDLLLEYTLQHPREVGQTTFLLNLAAVHNDQIYLTTTGTTHSFILTKALVQDYCDLAPNVRGLGVSRNLPLRYFQASLQPGDLLIITPVPPSAWTQQALSGSSALSLDVLRRRLLHQVGTDLNAAVFQFQEGKGQLHRLKPRSVSMASESSQAAPRPVENIPAPVATPVTPPTPAAAAPLMDPAPASAERPAVSTPFEPAPTQRPAVSMPPIEPAQPQRSTAAAAPVEPEAEETPATSRRAERIAAAGEKMRPALGAVWQKAAQARASLNQGMRRFLPRLLPNSGDQPVSLSPGALLFIAIAVPVIIVAIALTIYLRSGYTQQHDVYLKQAQGFAEQARQQTDPILQRSNWEQALHWVNQAEKYGQTDESQKLHSETQLTLDGMDKIQRLDFQPGNLSGVGASVQISRMVVSGTDLYILDGSKGSAMRMLAVGGLFEQDTQFNCGPGKLENGILIGPLVDIVALPPANPHQAAVAGIDASGNLVFCQTGTPMKGQVLTPPENQWGKISGLLFNQDILYVMDTGEDTRAVWRYPADVGMVFNSAPQFFFGAKVPNLSDITGLGINQNDLYLLHQNGQISLCTFSEYTFSPTQCSDPAPFEDTRAGRESRPLMLPDARPILMQVTLPPDSAVYLLDSTGPSLFKLTMRLGLQSQFRTRVQPQYPLPNRAPSAFAVSPDLTFYLAFGNQIYYARLP